MTSLFSAAWPLTDDEDIRTLDARAAQHWLERAFGGAGEVMPGEQSDQPTVVPLTDDQEIPSLDNPFAQAAAETQTKRRLEALLFASPKPLTESMLQNRLNGAAVRPYLEALAEEYEGRGIELREVAGGWQFVTAADVANVLVEYRTQERKLSRAALETLAIIAYHQPCSRADIEEVRGVAVAKGSLDQLLDLGWIKIRGRREVPGRPLLYGTTPAFLEHFGLTSIDHLPGLSDLKAAGLLDARLPPGFSVPTPTADDGEDRDESDDAASDTAREFSPEFHDPEDENS